MYKIKVIGKDRNGLSYDTCTVLYKPKYEATACVSIDKMTEKYVLEAKLKMPLSSEYL
jgi:hypothetical protein